MRRVLYMHGIRIKCEGDKDIIYVYNMFGFYICARAYIGTSGIVKQVGGRAANSIAIKSFNLFRFSCKRRVSAAARSSKKRLLASITRERTAVAAATVVATAAAMLDQKDTWQRLYFRWPLLTSRHHRNPHVAVKTLIYIFRRIDINSRRPFVGITSNYLSECIHIHLQILPMYKSLKSSRLRLDHK